MSKRYDTMIALYPDGTFILMGYDPEYHDVHFKPEQHQPGTRFFILDSMDRIDTLKAWVARCWEHEDIRELVE